MTSKNIIARDIHYDMCTDERNGYSWEERWGQAGHPKVLEFDGKDYSYNLGDYDCSSSTIKAWREALKGTPYEGTLDGALSTHSMRNVFAASGLFDVWDTNSTTAQPGDLYLNDQNHVAMCQTVVPDMLSEFSWGDVGAYGNKRGDQSGWESHITGFYNYPWSCTLHYNGKADYDTGQSVEILPDRPKDKPTDKTQPKYRAYVGGRWLDKMVGRVDTGWSDDDYAGILGTPILYLAIKGVGKYRVCTQRNGWLPWVDKYDTKDLENGCAGDGSPIIAVEIPNADFRYAAHDSEYGWHEPMVGNKDTAGTGETYAGDMKPIDGFWLEKA